MDLLKLQKKFGVSSKEIEKAIHDSADDFFGSLTNEITEPEAAERINNLKDVTLEKLKYWGILDDHNKHLYLGVIFKSIVDQYWRQKDLPKEERAIFKIGFTDKKLKEAQQKQLDEFIDGEKFYKRKVKEFKQIIKEWWQQRADEEAFYKKGKLNGKRKP